MFTEKRKSKIFGNSDKKGISAIIATVILIALAVAAIAIIWVYVKVTLNDRFTCYDAPSNETVFSISIGDVEVDEILVGISAGGTSKSLRIRNDAAVEYLDMWPSSGDLKLPGKNEGLTYVLDMRGAELIGPPSIIQISPVIKGVQCDVSDSMVQIESC